MPSLNSLAVVFHFVIVCSYSARYGYRYVFISYISACKAWYPVTSADNFHVMCSGTYVASTCRKRRRRWQQDEGYPG